MGELLPALVTAGVGVVLLGIVVLLVLRPVRRFSRASAALRAGVTAGVSPLQAMVNARRRGSE